MVARAIAAVLSRAPNAFRALRDGGLDAVVSSLSGPHLPGKGYLMSLLLWVMAAAGFTPSAEIDSLPTIPFARGTPAGLARICGDKAQLLFQNRPLAMMRLAAALEALKEHWHLHGHRCRFPTQLNKAVLAVQLCQWKRDKFSSTCGDLRIAIAGANSFRKQNINETSS